MRDTLRQWFVDSPCALSAAYVVVLGGSVLWQVGTQDCAGCYHGP